MKNSVFNYIPKFKRIYMEIKINSYDAYFLVIVNQ